MKKNIFKIAFIILIGCCLTTFISSLSWSHTLETECYGNAISHTHPTEQYTYEEAVYQNNLILSTYTCIPYYAHLPSTLFNCHAFAYDPGNYCWIGDPDEIIYTIWPDDFEDADSPYAVYDRVAYYKDGELTHSGTVMAVSGGNITLVRSKWGSLGLYDHPPTCVPSTYGSMDVVKRFTGCSKKSLLEEESKKDYDYLSEEAIYMDEERLCEL
jgi:hypothetical protein